MTKWQQTLQNLAEAGDGRASDILWEIRDMSDDELARYLAENHDKVSSVIGLKYLAEKDADPELNKEYYDMLNKGQHAFEGSDRVDAMGFGKARSVDDWMKIFGIQPKHTDGYSDDERAAFTNPASPTHYSKLKTPDQFKQIASWQGFDTPALMEDDLRRSSDMFQRGLSVEGWNPDNTVDLVRWAKSAFKGFAMPRVKEAELEGREPEWRDYLGDATEAGLNFIPGVGFVSKAGKVVARIPNSWVQKGVKGVIGAAEASAVPGLSQVYDINVYDEGPRSQWDTGRFLTQAGSFGGGMYAGNRMLRQGKTHMAGREGGMAAAQDFKNARTGIARIGEKTDDILAERQAVLDMNAKLAQDRSNVNLAGDVGIKTGKPNGPKWEDVADAESNRILTEEANRIGRSEEERRAYQQLAESRKQELAGNKKKNVDRDTYMQNKEEQYFKNPEDYPVEGMPNDPDFIFVDEEQIPLRPGFVRTVDSKGNPRIVKQSDVELYGGVKPESGNLTADEMAVVEAYRKANEAGAKDIVQLPDGRFVYRDNIDIDGNYSVGGGPANGGYSVTQLDMGGRPAELQFQYNADFAPNKPVKKAAFGGKNADRGYGLGEVKDRDQVVKAAIEGDDYLGRKAAGKGNLGMEQFRDAGVSFGVNSAYHNDLVKSKLGNIDDKRAEAYWNSQMKKLSELTSSKYGPETRKQNFEAVMDVMAYGLNNIPDEKFRKRPEVYHDIAARLGRPDWQHPSETMIPVAPTNSTSTATYSSSSSAD